MKETRISDIGEKRLIAEFVQPLFNSGDDVGGVGDDCAMLEGANGEVWLFSTDRVPADLISFKLGILDYYGLGKYLARLNLSDISACGGVPRALLLNLGLPEDLPYEDFKAICRGFGEMAQSCDCQVLGGDITSSKELSISATSIGTTLKGRVLTRRGAKPGDSIFISRPLGVTPAAFGYYLRCDREKLTLSDAEISILNGQFTALEPLVNLGCALAESGKCSSCMDNSDGVGQSLLELSIASKVRFVVREKDIELPPVVSQIACSLNEDPIQLAFSAGSDFSLVGTLEGAWSLDQAKERFGTNIRILGYVEDGDGVFLDRAIGRKALEFSGWNYFTKK